MLLEVDYHTLTCAQQKDAVKTIKNGMHSQPSDLNLTHTTQQWEIDLFPSRCTRCSPRTLAVCQELDSVCCPCS